MFENFMTKYTKEKVLIKNGLYNTSKQGEPVYIDKIGNIDFKSLFN